MAAPQPPDETPLPADAALARQKAVLRVALSERRQAVAARIGDAAAAAVASRIADLVDPAESAVVAGYWPLDGELDPRPCLERLEARGHFVALPRMQGSGRPLAFHAWKSGEALIAARFKVMEPSPEAAASTPRVLLVPLLAFDRRGRRLGYGKGYYDLTLRELRRRTPRPLAIGLAFAAQEVADVPAGPHDEILDIVVTEAAIHRCSPPLAGDRAAHP